MKKYNIVIFVILFIYMFVLGAVAFSEGMFFSLYANGMSIYLIINLLILIVFGGCIVWLYRKSNEETASFGASLLTTTMLLHLGSSIMLVLLFFLSGSTLKAMVDISNSVLLQSVVLIVLSAFACLSIFLLKKLLNKGRMSIIITLLLSSTVSLIAGVIMALFHENGSTLIHGAQVGLLACYIAIVQFSLILYSSDKDKLKGISKSKHIGLIFYSVIGMLALIAGYFVSSEYGIPMFLIASIAIWYIFYNKRKLEKIDIMMFNKRKTIKINLTLIIIVLVVLLVVFTLVYYYYVQQGIIKSEAFGHLGDKIGRMFPPKDKDDTRFIQRDGALARLATSGFFGSYDFSYVYAASSDYSIALTTHYTGWIWLVIVLASFCVTIISGNKYWLKNKSELYGLETISCVSFIYIFFVSFYNILSNTGIAGIIGVSCFASGYGYSNTILSGLLLGSVMYNLFENVNVKSSSEKSENEKNIQIKKIL